MRVDVLLHVLVGGPVKAEQDLGGLAAARGDVRGQGAVEDVVGQSTAAMHIEQRFELLDRGSLTHLSVRQFGDLDLGTHEKVG